MKSIKHGCSLDDDDDMEKVEPVFLLSRLFVGLADGKWKNAIDHFITENRKRI